MSIPIYRIKVPEYNVRTKPDHAAIGAKIDNVIKRHFLDRKSVV